MLAVAEFKEALESRTQTLGEYHEDTLNTKYRLGLAYSDAGNTNDAISEIKAVVDAKDRALAHVDPQIYESLAALYERAAQPSLSAYYLRKAFSTDDSGPSADFPRRGVSKGACVIM
jgi:Tfp pilus assembly protein PilF